MYMFVFVVRNYIQLPEEWYVLARMITTTSKWWWCVVHSVVCVWMCTLEQGRCHWILIWVVLERQLSEVLLDVDGLGTYVQAQGTGMGWTGGA